MQTIVLGRLAQTRAGDWRRQDRVGGELGFSIGAPRPRAARSLRLGRGRARRDAARSAVSISALRRVDARLGQDVDRAGLQRLEQRVASPPRSATSR